MPGFEKKRLFDIEALRHANIYRLCLIDMRSEYEIGLIKAYRDKWTFATGTEYIADFWNRKLAAAMGLKSYQVYDLILL